MNKKQQEAIQLAEFAIHCAQKHGAEQVNVYIQSSENEKLVITDGETENLSYNEQQVTQPIHVEKTVGRNDPCPCGSGKKYKNCHGKNA